MLYIISIGLIAGIVAKLLVPSKDHSEFVVTVTLSIVAAIIAIVVGQWVGVYDTGEPASFFGAVAGSMIILWIYKIIQKINDSHLV
jgi:uncharacterized membrane protein YeaQ/YmgE (transglycosylase-associated protein family)